MRPRVRLRSYQPPLLEKGKEKLSVRMILTMVLEKDLYGEVKQASVRFALIEMIGLLLDLFDAFGCGEYDFGHDTRDEVLSVIVFISYELREVYKLSCLKQGLYTIFERLFELEVIKVEEHVI